MKKTLAAVAAGVTAAVAFAIPAVAADTSYYAGGTRQSGQPSHTSETEWEAFLGQGLPAAYTVQYARDLAPLIGVSQGAVVMARTKQALITNGVNPSRITVLTYGDPTNPDGGFLSKLDQWNINIPGYTPVTNTPGQGRYETVAIEYDLIADSPDNLNPVSWANAALGAIYDHPTYSNNLLTEATADGRVVSDAEKWVQVSDDGQPEKDLGSYQHDLIKQKNLPITRPIRDFGTAVADDQGDVAVNRIVDQLDNVLRPIVDAGYDGGEPGGTRHVGTTTTHYQDADGNPVANPNRSVAEKPKRPLRDVVKKVGDTIKKVTDGLKPKANS